MASFKYSMQNNPARQPGLPHNIDSGHNLTLNLSVRKI